jgi:hypothetical protein
LNYFYWVKAWDGKRIKKKFFTTQKEAYDFLKNCVVKCKDRDFLFDLNIKDNPIFQVFQVHPEAAHLLEEGSKAYDPNKALPQIQEMKLSLEGVRKSLENS